MEKPEGGPGSRLLASGPKPSGHALTVPAAFKPYLGVTAALFYGFMAVSMTFVNKLTIQVFPLTNTVVALQMVATWVILQPLRDAGYLDFPSFSMRKARQLFWITALYTANTAFALVGLKSLNVPMYNVLKRLTPMLVLTVKAVVRKRWPEGQITGSVLMVVVGCLVAGIGDLTFDAAGYLYAIASCTSQAAYLLLVEFQGAGGVGTTELLYYNAITSLPLLLGVVFLTGEASVLPGAYAEAAARVGTLQLWTTVLSCSLMGCLLNYALFLCTTTNSALTTTIVGVLKGVAATALGFFLLGGVPFNLVNVVGIVMNTAGGIWYTVIKYQAKAAAGAGGAREGGGSGGGAAAGGLGEGAIPNKLHHQHPSDLELAPALPVSSSGGLMHGLGGVGVGSEHVLVSDGVEEGRGGLGGAATRRGAAWGGQHV